MNCQSCDQRQATVHVTEIQEYPVVGRSPDGAQPKLKESHLCEPCAASMKLPYGPVVSVKQFPEIWKLLKQSAKRAREQGSLACPDCGMTLAEFRSKGRLGCPKDYQVFGAHLKGLLLRVHNATEHVGRVPGLDDSERERMQSLTSLRAQLEEAIKQEAYESAARLRDAIQQLETSDASASRSDRAQDGDGVGGSGTASTGAHGATPSP